MIVHFNGVRGSLPLGKSPLQVQSEFEEYLSSLVAPRAHDFKPGSQNFFKYCGLGTHTTSITVEQSDKSDFLLIDGGTGITSTIPMVLSRYANQRVINILITHFHWDHLMGLPFFTPIYIPGKIVNFFGVQDDLQECIRSLFKKPFFPVSFDELQSEVNFIKVKPYEKTNISNFDVTFYKLDHPDPCFGPRIESKGKSYCHAVDTESDRVSPEQLGKDQGMYENVDLMHFDAPYMEDEIQGPKKNWGHASVDRAFQLAEKFHIKRITFGHYTPEIDYAKFCEIQAKAKLRFQELPKDVQKKLTYEFSYDGQIVKI